MRVAIYGAGSLGTILGAYISKAGVAIELINRNKAHVEALQTQGAKVVGTVDFIQPVVAYTPAEMSGTYDIIFLMTKQQHNAEVVNMLKGYLADDGVLVTFQNGLPEMQSFAMLFVRIDVLASLDIEIPKTWEDIYVAQSKLESNNMEIGVTTDYKIFLYQMGGLFYNDKQYSALNEPKALSAFAEYTKLYREYGLTVSFDFANRFRSGEMPMAIVDYTMFNTLEVFSPEIKGLWNIAPVPGTENNGVIDNSVACEVQGTMMIADSISLEKISYPFQIEYNDFLSENCINNKKAL